MDPPAPARGRKRFLFDIQKAEKTAEQGIEVKGLRLLSVSKGEEDGSFDCAIARADGEFVAALTFLVSDASEYPSDHTFFCSSQEKLPAAVSSVVESVHEEGSRSIQDILMRLLEKLAKRVSDSGGKAGQRHAPSDDEEEGDGEDEDEGDYDMDDEMALLGTTSGRSRIDRSVLQREFNEAVSYNYSPGFIPFGLDDFALSVSMPAKSLADTIPARALMAWDKRLLSRPQHLTLLISGLRGVYPIVQPDATYSPAAHVHGAVPQFRVGLTTNYKPTPEDATETVRKYGLKEEYDVEPQETEPIEELPLDSYYDDYEDLDATPPPVEEEKEEEPEIAFRSFSLSSSLESLLNSHFLRIVQFRLQYDLGWAGAETLRWQVELSQQPPGDIMRLHGQVIRTYDAADEELARSYILPADPLLMRNPEEPINIPLVAFSYLLRRITLCPRYCLVCHQQLQDNLDALKPYVCNSKLCTYQYYNLNRGPSLEYEICANPDTVDLLVSLAYIAAAEGALDAPLPVGMGLRVRVDNGLPADSDGMVGFDELDLTQMRITIARLIDLLPPIADMKKHLERQRKPGQAKPNLKGMDKTIPDAAWSVLRWCVASCTAHLEELREEHEVVKNIGSDWRQFRFSVGAPDAEARFRMATQQAQMEDANARVYPSLYAFHGSPAKNWHSIIRHGLWFKTIAHGRAYGHGVYFAKDGTVSFGSYSAGASACWRNSAIRINSCAALAEIVNLPRSFVSTNPFFVVDKTDWIICRYLMIKGSGSAPFQLPSTAQPLVPTAHTLPMAWATVGGPPPPAPQEDEHIPYVPLDPAHPLTLSHNRIRIPQPSYALEKILEERRREYVPVDYDEEDLRIFFDAVTAPTTPEPEPEPEAEEPVRPAGDWTHDRAWVEECVEHLIPPPTESSVAATTALQRELKAMLREQGKAKSLSELGWYMPEDLIGDNLYQWIVELHTFDKDIPVARDMVAQGVNSLVFEIRFPATFPHTPPFFRILKPRFLPFSQGGGGHITLGGSMCMDLLTADGWLPSYSIAAILLQIKLAISNLDPRPARLAHNWNSPYGMQEALEGYKRVAAVHGWKIPQGIEKLTSF